MADRGGADGGRHTPNLAALERHVGRRGRQVLAGIAVAQASAPAVRWAVQRARQREDFTITVPGIDDVYAELHEWVLARIPEDERKALIASTSERNYGLPTDGLGEPPRVRLRYDGQRTQTVTIDGHKLKVQVAREEIPGGRESLPDNWRQLMEKITFTATSAAGRDAIVTMIEGLAKAKHTEPGPPPLFVPARWGGEWVSRRDLPSRSLDSVILRDGQLERLAHDLRDFLDGEEEYNRFSQPWHRGYLFHGTPGTGKTSVARALAGYFEMPTYYLPLGDLEKDANLMSLVGQISPRSMLLIEDVDAFHTATSRDQQDKTVSIAAMLNALDGVWTPHGLVLVMTTNHREALDDALLRPGRVDVDEEFLPLDLNQARRLAAWMGGGPDSYSQYVGASPASMIQALRGGLNETRDQGRPRGGQPVARRSSGHGDPAGRQPGSRPGLTAPEAPGVGERA